MLTIKKSEQDRLGVCPLVCILFPLQTFLIESSVATIDKILCSSRALLIHSDLQHHLFKLTFDGKLYLAPLKDIKGGIHNSLDIATGTGIWALEFGLTPIPTISAHVLTCPLANEFPSASVIGTDLSPIQPDL
jgi:hypothetical protein